MTSGSQPAVLLRTVKRLDLYPTSHITPHRGRKKRNPVSIMQRRFGRHDALIEGVNHGGVRQLPFPKKALPPDPGLERAALSNGGSLHAGVSCEGEQNARKATAKIKNHPGWQSALCASLMCPTIG